MTTPVPKRRWLHFSPDRFVLSLLLVICLLWLSERFQWFGFNHHKGWTVLIAVAAVGVAALVMLVWWATGLIFGWRFQFSIRSLLVFCLACSVLVSWLAVEMKEARRQAEAIAAIQSLGGEVEFYSGDEAAGYYLPNPVPPGPEWFQTTLGDDFFSTVAAVICDSTVTDAGLEHLKGLTKLQELSLTDTKVTDAGLEHLKGLTKLQELHLNGTTITDVGLKHLEGLTELQKLWLGGTEITDGGLEYLKELNQLQSLSLYGTEITDAGLEHLKGLTQLLELSLDGTKVTDAGVKKLRQALPNCEIHH